jgi:hypothetical protein
MPDPDYRALCAELLTAIQLYTKLNPASSEMSAFELTEKLMDAMAATNAALAQLEPEGDEGIDDLVAWLWSMRDLAGECNPDEQRRYGLAATLLGQKAAETTHWRPATLAQPEPQEEAGEVADWLHDHALSCRELGRNDWAAQSTRAATLLQQLSAIENLKTTNWKARCAELADRLDDALTYTVQSDTERSMRQLITRTRTALAQPEPEGPPMPVPGDAEGLAEVFWGRYEQPEPQGPTERIASIATAVREWAFGWEPTARLIGNVCAEDVADLCGAILTRWGRPTIEPVPVAKRLPGPGDCLGRPWEETDAGFAGGCFPLSEKWCFLPGPIWKGSWQCSPPLGASHWLPHHALPVPGAEAGND